MKSNLLVSEFKDCIRDRAEANYAGKMQQAFVDWYVEAEFGGVEWKFTDDANDGGIDAIVMRSQDKPGVVIIQSKFTEHVGRGSLSRGAYEGMERVAGAFRWGEDAFSEFLTEVRADLRQLYRKAHQAFTGSGGSNWNTGKRAFRLITTHSARSFPGNGTLGKNSFHFADDILRLYEQYRRGQTPRANDLRIHVEAKLPYRDPERNATSYLFNARVSDFRRYFDNNDVGRLVARNIRYNLAGRIAGKIRTSYEKHPRNFWYMHNGLTIICDDYVEQDELATLVNPSVVNGAQTLYAIAASPRKQSPAMVPTRVIVRGKHTERAPEDDRWVQGIIRGVNTQNRVRAQDFRSNEPEQLELQRLFRDQKVFFERKRGEWREFKNEPRFRGFGRTSLAVLGQALTATSEPDGSGVLLVKRGVEVIFDKYYQEIFPNRTQVAKRFPRIYLAYRIARFVRKHAYDSKKEFRKQQHAYWTTVWLMHRGISSAIDARKGLSVEAIRNAFDRFESRARTGQQARGVARATRKKVWSAWRVARIADTERWNSINFFKNPWGNQKVLRLAYPKVRRNLESLGKQLAKAGA